MDELFQMSVKENRNRKVSVIVPVYNTEQYLAQCLESCVHQTLEFVEVIVINDGSTDGSLRIAEEYAEKYGNIIVKSIENSGLSVARNTGMAMARGKYIAFCDSDDWLDTECLEQSYQYAEKYSLEIVTYDAQIRNECADSCSGSEYSRFDMINATQIYTGREFVEKYRQAERVSAWMYFVRRDFLERHKICFLPNAVYEDHKFFMDCMAHAVRVRYLPHELYYYRIRPHSIMTSEITLRKVSSPYELCMGMLGTMDKLYIGTKEKLFWFAYIAEKIKDLILYSYHNTASEKLYRFLELHYDVVKNLQYQFLCKYWEGLLRVGNHPQNISVMLTCFENTLYGTGVLSEREEQLIEEVYTYRNVYCYQELQKLPFSDEKKKIGIYGMGKHTWGLLRNYKKLVGEIKCRITYIDSNVISYTSHIGLSDVINISDAASAGLDGIVISSFLHEKEMLEIAKAAVGDTVPVYTIYDGKDYWIDTDTVEENKIRERILSCGGTLQERRFCVIAAPEHANTGDYLIARAVREYLEKYFPDRRIMEITGPAFLENRENVVARISRLDTILVMGGGFFGSLWLDGEVTQRALEWFPDNKIVILPQTLYFEDNGHGYRMREEMCRLVNNHRNLTICYREKISFRRGKELFGENIPQYVFPDMALLLPKMDRHKERNGILLCLRTDEESVLSKEQREEITNIAASTGQIISETSMQWHRNIKSDEADEILCRKLDEIAGAKLIIADALHCVISCALTGTPCIALPSTTGKMEGVYQWIKNLPYIRYITADKPDKLMEHIGESVDRLLAAGSNGEVYSYDLDFKQYERELADLII